MNVQLEISSVFAAPPRWTVTKWADERRILTPEDSAEPGRYKSDRAPYQKGIQDAIGDPKYRLVVMMLASQVGKTAILLNAIGRSIDIDPSPILTVLPTLAMAEAFSKERFAPMVRDTPELRDRIAPNRTRDSGNTILHKNFPGGHITFAGANSPASLASRPIRYLYCDEVDKFGISAGTDGDPIDQAIQRTATYGYRRSIVLDSTPGIQGRSRIEKAWLESDQRYYTIPCPHCGFYQSWTWDQIVYPNKGLENADPSKPQYKCINCDHTFPESQKNRLLKKGVWTPTAQGNAAGFHLESLCSPWQSWSDLARDYEIARKDTMRLMVWWNLKRGLPFDLDAGMELDSDHLLNRADKSEYESGEIPDGALLLSAGVDVQKDRLECSVYGWGEGEQCWLICHYRFDGDPMFDDVWKSLASFLNKQFGTWKQRIAAVCVDTGGTGGQTQDTYGQCRKQKRWYAIKGRAGDRALVSTPSWVDVTFRGRKYQGHRGLQLYTLGVDKAKETLHSRIRNDDPGPKFINLPRDIDGDWAEGFCSEKMIVEHKQGIPKTRWVKITERNEPLDCAVYAYCAAHLAGLPRMNWAELRANLTRSKNQGEDISQTKKKTTKPRINPLTRGRSIR